jgi:hypothetical protein
MRVAAFVWMLLVACGLVLIVTRIVLDRSNGWLIRMNLMALAGVVYVCMFVNFPALVASYNVADSRDMGGKGPSLDINYLTGLGPQAIPAFDRFIGQQRPGDEQSFICRRNALATAHRAELDSWRAWSFRSWRLQLYLDKAEAVAGVARPTGSLDRPAENIR